jgi:xanthine dehydrogenase accessory factor
MILADDDSFAGALSGGCVEKEVMRNAQSVFRTGEKVIFPYDGQYRLGCKGVIHILLEKLEPATAAQWIQSVRQFHRERKFFKQGLAKDDQGNISSWFEFDGKRLWCSRLSSKAIRTAERDVLPQRQLIIVGNEHDSAQLALLAAHSGFQVRRIVGKTYPLLPAQPLYQDLALEPAELPLQLKLDAQSALVLMTHSLSRDFSFLRYLLAHSLTYLGVLGPPKRKEELLNSFLEQFPEESFTYIDQIERIHGPVGFDIGGRTPEEIAVAILAEIIAAFNHRLGVLQPLSLEAK